MTEQPIRPGDPRWPVAWMTYSTEKSIAEDFADLKAHGVGLVSERVGSVEEARQALAQARQSGMMYHINLPEITEQGGLVPAEGRVDALMIGGAFRGKAIDRHLFSFTAGPQTIIIEPPVYNPGYAYTRGSKPTGAPAPAERIGHYYPDMGAPVKAEVVVPLRRFDGTQHLAVLPATIAPAPAGARPEVDSLTPEMQAQPEGRDRKLYTLTFDLTGYEGALLDQVGIAVYWAYHGTNKYWIFGRGDVSARAESTREAMRAQVRRTLQPWIEANGGTFPLDVVLAARFGDECFFITGHSIAPVVSYPLWDFSAPSVSAFQAHVGEIAYPRTWGFPEIYGPDAYAWWMYTLHEGCAELCGVVRDEIAKVAPGLLLFRNTTRMGIFDISNDHDGSGQELLARNLDLIHLDPYPVVAAGYTPQIPRDMSYCAGLARRYQLPLVPWMQAHTYGGPEGLQHVTPEQVDRMAEEQWQQGVDAVIWLGYGRGNTFPKVNPQSWERAGAFHQRLQAAHPPVPQPRLAVLRPYRTWALWSKWEDQVRNPADWLLQQFLEVWAVQQGQPYDVFELPPAMTAEETAKLEATLAGYEHIVTTQPRAGAWVIGAGTESTTVDPATATAVQQQFAAEMRQRGWLK